MEDAQNGSPTTIMDIPDDCLVFIFKWLTCASDREAFGLTCHRWLDIESRNRESLQFECSFTNFSAWLSRPSNSVDPYKLHRVLNRFRHLKSLYVSGCTELVDSDLKQLQNCGSTLRELHLDCCFSITDNGLSVIGNACPLLTFISLYRCSVTDSGLEALAKSCSALININLSYCSYIRDSGIRSLVQKCLRLRAMKISNCKGITGVGFQGCSPMLAYLEAESCKLEPEGISSIVSGGGLEHLNVASLSWSIYGDGLAALGSGSASRLRFLNLRLCRTIGDSSVAAIAKGCPSLVEWNLAVCHEVRAAGWESIALNCHNLERLHVNRCRNLCEHGLQALKNGCRKLSVLYMDGCPRIGAVAVSLFKLARGDVIILQEQIRTFGSGPEFWQ